MTGDAELENRFYDLPMCFREDLRACLTWKRWKINFFVLHDSFSAATR